MSETMNIAAEQGNVPRLRALLAEGVSLNGAKVGSDSPLCYAAMYGKPDAVKWLVDSGAAVNHRGAYGRTPLLYAATGTYEGAAYLLAHGADIAAKDEGGDDALQLMLHRQAPDILTLGLLLQHGFDLSYRGGRYPKSSHLMAAASQGHLDVMRMLLKAGVDVNEHAHLGTALSAALNGNLSRGKSPIPALRVLLTAKVDPALNGPDAEPLLFELCKLGDVGLVERLLELGANANERLRNGRTALTRADESGNPAVNALLISRGARPNRTGPIATDALRALEAAATAQPTDAEIRLNYAHALALGGFRGGDA